MSLFTIAFRSIQQRGVASLLTMASMALGVMLVVAVLSIHGVVSQSFRNNASLGCNMIVGPKGGKEQLVLNTVYYLSAPVENIPYTFYLEFKSKSERETLLAESFDALVISDYGKGVVVEDELSDVVRTWRTHKKPVLVDPHIPIVRQVLGLVQKAFLPRVRVTGTLRNPRTTIEAIDLGTSAPDARPEPPPKDDVRPADRDPW